MAEPYRRPTKQAQQLRNGATDCERLLWLELRGRRLGGYKFSRQIPVGRYICDFICRRSMLVVELDGGQHSAEADAVRTQVLERAGYRVIRFWNNEVVENLGGVLQAILAELEAGPPPNPLSVGEGEFSRTSSSSPSPSPSREREGSR